VRNLIRRRPLEVEEVAVGSRTLRVPPLAEIARAKAWLCLIRNATRDYLDFAARTFMARESRRDRLDVLASRESGRLP
jgi:hypothetical protein